MTVAELKEKRKSKKKSFNTYANRRNGVRTIVSNIDDKFDDDIRDINNKISACISELQQGLKGSTKLSTVCSAMEGTKEKSTGSDSKMSSCRSYVKSEQTRCQGRINTLDAEIKELERQIKAQGGTIYFWE